MRRSPRQRILSDRFERERLVRAIYRALKDDDVQVRLERMTRQLRGDWLDGKVRLDYRENLLLTACHELLHHAHPDWPEERVQKAEDFLAKHLTPRIATNILRKVVERLK